MSGVPLHDSGGRLSTTLRNVAAALSGPTVSLRRGLELIGEEGMLLVCAVLALPFLIPVSIPGVSTVFGLAILLLALGLLERDGWLIVAGQLMNAATVGYFGILVVGAWTASRGLGALLG